MLYLHNSSRHQRPLQPAGAPANSHHAWVAEPDACPDGSDGSCAALAVFNAGNFSSQVIVNLTSLRLGNSTVAAPPQLCGRNLWTRRPLVPTPVVDVFAPKVRGGTRGGPDIFSHLCNRPQLPRHGAALYVLWRSYNCTSGDEMFVPSASRHRSR